ncbi:unnamed protein product (macronuclear) [Paramecium tetraurelia]|uniref:Protein kinase domain-containing protein n=1 Tax=Paramecium tetraurelia TaxID=5888 RepID=A0CHU3_PARTE|nr:uncharacterized protein GSPATT00038462001 [Paramecium tetraurelia]CAK70360.1 unnamed protein product [Paramecium tetraurelia]|eukprot:XP_001437757.1 hypothetical protein (macronuclear) [Paramecium tetraurelia strain d4-2]
MQQTQQNWQGKQINAATTDNPNRNYKIESVLGSGSQGSVYLGKHIMNSFQQNNVAIKIQQFMSEQEIQFLKSLIQYQKQYENNKQNAQSYNPSQIVKIFDFFQYNEFWIIVMELGTQDLYKFISQKQQLPIQQLGQVLKQITKSIAFLHENQLLHRDIKPENYILIGDEYKLIDFGLVTTQFRSKTTNVGTVLYQAPELITNENNYTQTIDIWSLGCLFYEILSGQTLIYGVNQDQVQKMILAHRQDCNAINLRINSLSCNKEIKDMIIRMLDPNPPNRLQCQQVMEILDSKFCLQKFPIINNFQPQVNIMKAQYNQFPIVQYQQTQQQQQGIPMQFNQQNQQLSSHSQSLVEIQKQLALQQTLLESITTNFTLLGAIVQDSKQIMNEIQKGQEQQKFEINQIKNDLKAEIQNIFVDKLESYQNNIISKLDKFQEEQQVTMIDQQQELLFQNKDFIIQIQQSITNSLQVQEEFQKLIKESLNNQEQLKILSKESLDNQEQLKIISKESLDNQEQLKILSKESLDKQEQLKILSKESLDNQEQLKILSKESLDNQEQLKILSKESLDNQEQLKILSKESLDKQEQLKIISKESLDNQEQLKIISKESLDNQEQLKILSKESLDKQEQLKIISKESLDNQEQLKIISKESLDNQEQLKILSKESLDKQEQQIIISKLSLEDNSKELKEYNEKLNQNYDQIQKEIQQITKQLQLSQHLDNFNPKSEENIKQEKLNQQQNQNNHPPIYNQDRELTYIPSLSQQKLLLGTKTFQQINNNKKKKNKYQVENNNNQDDETQKN